MSVDDAITLAVRAAVSEAIAPLRDDLRALKDQVGIGKRVYTLFDLWQLLGGKNSGCKTLESFRHRKDLPEPDSRNGRHLAFSRETVDAWLSKLTKKPAGLKRKGE